MRRSITPHTAQLHRMIDGYQVAQAIAVAATLGIADLVADGPKTSKELARITGAHPRALHRLLRALASVDVFTQDNDGRFAMTPLAEGLRGDIPGSLRAWAIHAGQPYMQAAWAHLHYSVTTGEPAFPHVHGVSSWQYRQQHPTAGQVFDEAMGASAHDATDIVHAYDFGAVDRVVDVGGGHGALIAAILTTYPNVRGTLFDQPHVVDGAAPTLHAAGVADRCAVVAGDFFDEVPASGDLYILKGVIHDWDDDSASRILRTCRRAMTAERTLLLIEQIIPIDDKAGASAYFMDLHMLVIHGGVERTADDLAALLASAGLRQTRVVPTKTGLNLIEAVPV
ncbi:MAG: methyltransferase [Thermomicrobiales bacterium]